MRQNIGLSPLVLPDGKTVEPGDTFDESKVPADQLERWSERIGPVTRTRKPAASSTRNDETPGDPDAE